MLEISEKDYISIPKKLRMEYNDKWVSKGSKGLESALGDFYMQMWYLNTIDEISPTAYYIISKLIIKSIKFYWKPFEYPINSMILDFNLKCKASFYGYLNELVSLGLLEMEICKGKKTIYYVVPFVTKERYEEIFGTSRKRKSAKMATKSFEEDTAISKFD